MSNVKQLTLREQIEESFSRLEFKPRGNQIDIVETVLTQFIDEGKRNVVLNAGTGIGKSVIGAVVSDVLNIYAGEEELASVIAMGTNILAQQYTESFSKLGKNKYFQIKGASNYACAFMEAQPMPPTRTADGCVRKKMHDTEIERYCRGCEYHESKFLTNKTDNLITNYAYFFIANLTSGHLKPRNLHIFDEAHTLNDAFCSFTEISISVKHIDHYIKELQDTNGKCERQIDQLVQFRQRLVSKTIDDANYFEALESLRIIYANLSTTLSTLATQLEKVDLVKSVKYDKMGGKYKNLAGKISDLTKNEYEHVFDSLIENTISIKTIFVSDMMESMLTKYNLFMSATITENFAYDTLNLKREQTAFIQLPAVFPRENKPIFFLGKSALNYTSLQNPDVIYNLKTQVKSIVEFHKDQKGLVLVPSFYLGSQVVSSIGRSTRIFEHKSGVNLPQLVDEFKNYTGSAVLVSPSIFEGLDFKNDDSRYQIIVKSPFASLADKRIKYISDKYPDIYKETTLLKILQGIGRSVRTPEDFACTYMLDLSSQRLFESRLNLWKDHYTVKT